MRRLDNLDMADPPKYEDLFPADLRRQSRPPRYSDINNDARRRSSVLHRSLSGGRLRTHSDSLDLDESLDRRSSGNSLDLDSSQCRRRMSEGLHLGEHYEGRETRTVLRQRSIGAEGATASAPTWKLIRRQSSLHSMFESTKPKEQGSWVGSLISPLVKALQNKLTTTTSTPAGMGEQVHLCPPNSGNSTRSRLSSISSVGSNSNSSTGPQHTESLSGDFTNCEVTKCHHTIRHMVAFVWTDIDQLKCVVNSMDNSDQCHGTIPLNFGIEGGFSVCKTHFCRTDYIFISGGHGSTASNFHQYNVFDMEWKQNKPLLVPRRNHAMVANAHKVYAIGGRQSDGSCVADVNVYNMKTSRWKNIGTLPTPVSHAITVKYGDVIHVIGGKNSQGNPTNVVQTIDTSDNKIVQLDRKLCAEVCSGRAVSSGGTRIYIAAVDGLFLEYLPKSRMSRKLSNHRFSHVFTMSSQYRGGIDIFGETSVNTVSVAQYKTRSNDWVDIDKFDFDGKIEHVIPISHCPL